MFFFFLRTSQAVISNPFITRPVQEFHNSSRVENQVIKLEITFSQQNIIWSFWGTIGIMTTKNIIIFITYRFILKDKKTFFLPPQKNICSKSGRISEACRLLSPSQFLDLILNTFFSKGTFHKSMCFRKDLFVIYGHLSACKQSLWKSRCFRNVSHVRFR